MTWIMFIYADAVYSESMHKIRSVVLLFSSALFALLLCTDAVACSECHSKNPKMVRMHEALEFKDCFTCHGPGAKMSPEGPQKQKLTDERCVRCHGKVNGEPLQQKPGDARAREEK